MDDHYSHRGQDRKFILNDLLHHDLLSLSSHLLLLFSFKNYCQRDHDRAQPWTLLHGI